MQFYVVVDYSKLTASSPAQREAEIQKLERLVWDAIYALQNAGLDGESRLRSLNLPPGLMVDDEHQ